MAVYEFRRGVHLGSLADDAAHAFELYLALYAVAEMDIAAWDEAAVLWADVARRRKRRGEPRPARDHDILIAASALRYGYGVATREKRRLGGIRAVRPALYVERW